MSNPQKAYPPIWLTQLIFVICLISNAAAEEKWQLVYSNKDKGNEMYLLNEAPVILDSSIRVWVLTNSPITGYSIVEYLEYDCNEPRVKSLDLHAYKGLMGEGTSLEYINKNKGEWKYAMPSSPGDEIRKALCKALI